jgi:hypothetical protein
VLQAYGKIEQISKQIKAAAQPRSPDPVNPPDQPKAQPGAVEQLINATITSAEELDTLISKLKALRKEIEAGKSITLRLRQ